MAFRLAETARPSPLARSARSPSLTCRLLPFPFPAPDPSRNTSPLRTPRPGTSATPSPGLSPSSTLVPHFPPGTLEELHSKNDPASTETTYGNDFSARDPNRASFRPPIEKGWNRPRTERSKYAEILMKLGSIYNPSRK